jgi:dihydroorotase
MIDPHVHLRDGRQAAKETLLHGLSVAWRAGLDGVFEMPNTDPPLTTRETILRRIEAADAALRKLGVSLFHGLYVGITDVPQQIEEAVKTWRELFPRVVGLKLFAGQSTGNMGITRPEEQALVYKILAAAGFTGVLAVHCEKEALLHPAQWKPAVPVSHTRARPPAAEVASVADQLRLAAKAKFKGTLHVCHVSTPWALDVVKGKHAGGAGGTAKTPPVKVTCGLTPHHALLDANMMEGPDGILLKVNPPLRPKPMPSAMLQRLFDGDVDWIETDHAPHTLADKRERYASGIPGIPFLPVFLAMLEELGLPAARVRTLSHDAVCKAFGLSIPAGGRKPDFRLSKEYPFDPFAVLTQNT